MSIPYKVNEKTIGEMLAMMSLEEKAALVNGASTFGTVEFSHLDVARVQFLDGGTGINFEQLFGDFYSSSNDADSTNGMIGSEALGHVIEYYYEPEMLSDVEYEIYEWIRQRLDEETGMPDFAPGCFPPGILLGATFNSDVVGKVGEALGLEARIYHIDVLLGTPNVNILRDPLNGRYFEGYSEDPCLVSELAPHLVKGVQSYGVGANVKHFAANNQETNRIGINEIISKRALEEIYFPGFKACVTAGDVRTVMSAYNKINGVACTENRWLLYDTLRKEWGFDGFVMSDWGAVYHPEKAVAAGNDLTMPGPISGLPIVNAIKSGTLSEEKLDEAVCHILQFIAWLKDKKKEATKIQLNAREIMDQTDLVAFEAAAEGIVLLKNKGNVFPITPDSNVKIHITGSGRKHLITCGTGSAGITTNRNTVLSKELSKLSGEDNIYVEENINFETVGFNDVVLAVVSLSGMEGNDRANMNLMPEDQAVLENLISSRKENTFRLAIVLNTCGPVDITKYEPFADAIINLFLPGMQGAKALANILTGKINPSGKLPFSWPKKYEDTPTFLNFPGEGWQVNYGEGIYVGYRYYDKKRIKPLYEFGYGLSYTSFEINNVFVDRAKFDDQLTLTGEIKNIGNRPGAEVVQLYLSDVKASQPKPVKELKKFQKIFLQPDETQQFSFVLSIEDFSYFDMDYDTFLVEEGYYELILATSSKEEDIVSVQKVYLEGHSPYSYGLDSTLKVLYEQPDLKKALLCLWEKEKIDQGILDINYQYSNCKTLRDIIPEGVELDPEKNKEIKNFLKAISTVIKE